MPTAAQGDLAIIASLKKSGWKLDERATNSGDRYKRHKFTAKKNGVTLVAYGSTRGNALLTILGMVPPTK